MADRLDPEGDLVVPGHTHVVTRTAARPRAQSASSGQPGGLAASFFAMISAEYFFR
jgi:hypothetical protein